MRNLVEHPVSNSRLYLTGFMGSGKSTIGPMVARRLGWDFSDLDDRIEAKIGTSIATFFTREGEHAFRSLESETLEESALLKDIVIAVGGGALCSEHNLEWALSHGTVVYLEVSTPYLVGRLRKEQMKRPMLLDADGNALAEEAVTERITSLLSTRIPFYTRAHLTVNTDNKSLSSIAHEIKDYIANTIA